MIAAWWQGFAVVGALGAVYVLAVGINAVLEVLARLLIGAWRLVNRPKPCGRVVCAWCVPMRDLRPAPELPVGKITHGICPACFAAQMTEVAAAHQETNCGAGGSADLRRTGTPRAEAAGAASVAPRGFIQTG